MKALYAISFIFIPPSYNFVVEPFTSTREIELNMVSIQPLAIRSLETATSQLHCLLYLLIVHKMMDKFSRFSMPDHLRKDPKIP